MFIPAIILASDQGSMTDQGFYRVTGYRLNNDGRRFRNEWLEWFWFGDGDPGDLLSLAQRPGVQEFQGGIMLPKPGRADGLLAENIHPAANMLLTGFAQVAAQDLLGPPGR
jgi:hypothetical protein